MSKDARQSYKKVISIVLVLLVVLGFSYFLYKISPKESSPGSFSDFDISGIKAASAPREIESGDYVKGNPLAKNTFVVYEDFECPACANFAPVVESVPTELKDTKVVFRHFPLSQHKKAATAAYAAEAAGAQGKFWEMYSSLYGTQAEWSGIADPLSYFQNLASRIGVSDLEKFSADVQGKIGKSKIETDLKEALGMQVNATPTVYFNGQKLELGDISTLKNQAEKLYKQ